MSVPLNPRTPAAALASDARKASAEAFLRTAAWSILQMRGGRGVAARGGKPRVTLRLFAPGCPAGCLREVIEILGTRVPERDIVADNSVHKGDWYLRAAWWQRDTGPARGRDATLTIYRDLSDGPVTETNTVEDGCGSVTTIRYVWDAAEVEDLSGIEHYGEQGFTVRIGGVSRDQETQLVSYYVAVTERKTQYIEEHLAGSDAFSSDYDASWLGLRGTIDAPTDDDGAGVTVYDPAVQAIGELLSAQWSRNLEDCTLDAQGKRRVAKPDVLATEGCSSDLFNEVDTTATVAQAAKLGHAPEPAGGVAWDYQSRLRPDRKWDNTKAKRTAKPVSTARRVVQADVFGKVEAVTNRNQADAPADPVAGEGVSGSASTQRTPEALRDNEITVRTENHVPDAEVTEQRTLFRRTLRSVAKSSPASRPAATAAGGVGVTASESRTPGGRRDISTETDEELFVGGATGAEQLSIFERTVRSTDANSPAEVPPASAGGGVIVSPEYSTNPLGTRNISVTTRTERPVSEASKSVSGDAFRETEETADSNQPDAVLPSVNPERGVLVTAQVAKTPGDLRNVSTRRTTAKPVARVSRVVDANAFFSTVSETDVNQPDAVTAPVGPVGGKLLGKRAEMNPDRTWNNTRTERTPVRDVQESKTTTVQGLVSSVSVSRRNLASPIPEELAQTPGVARTAVNTLNEFGEYDVREVIDTGQKFKYEYQSPSKRGITYVTRFFNYPLSEAVALAASLGTLTENGASVEGPNRFGLYDGTLHRRPDYGGSAGHSDRQPVDETGNYYYRHELFDSDGVTYVRIFRYTYDVKVDWGVSSGYNLYDGALSGSSFNLLGGDWYRFEKVTEIAVREEPLTVDATFTAFPAP